MAITNHERVGKALEIFRIGIAPYVEREVKSAVQSGALSTQVVKGFLDDPMLADKSIGEYDVSALMKLMWDSWNDVFKRTLSFAQRSLVSEVRTFRNDWAHQRPFSSDDTDRALDSMERLLTAVSAAEAEEVRKLKLELRRLVTDEQVRGERRKTAGLPLRAPPTRRSSRGAT